MEKTGKNPISKNGNLPNIQAQSWIFYHQSKAFQSHSNQTILIVVQNTVPSSYSVHKVTPPGLPPYFDYLSISKKVKGFDSSGLIRKSEKKFELKKDFTKIDVWWSDYYHTLTVNGSLPWFTNGHNLFFDQVELQTAINDLSIILDVDLAGAGVRSFELSKIIPVDIPVKEIQDNHLDLKGFERVQMQNTVYWNSYTRRGKKDLTLKMYNATDNAISKGMTIIPDRELLKFEMKMNSPSRHFGYAITVDELMYNEAILNKTYYQMKYHYSQIEKAKRVLSHSKLSSEEMALVAVVNTNKEPMKELERVINSAGLSKQARYKRRQRFRSKLEGLTVENEKYHLNI